MTKRPILAPLLEFERKHEPLAPGHVFARRVVYSLFIGFAVVLVALGVGIVGYRVSGGLSWLDSLYNASMILGGMGPVDTRPEIPAAEKWFASVYALFSGFAILIIAGVMFGPLFHRFIHRFHADVPERKP
jgi:hypothetical protein